VVFDDQFETVYAGDETIPDSWEHLCIFDRFEAAFDTEPPKLGSEWHNPEDSQLSQASVQGRKLYHQLHSKDTDIREDMVFEPPKLPVAREQQMSVPREPPDLRRLTQASQKIRQPREQPAPSTLTRRHEPRPV
jgi:hypothetical protein